MMTLDERVIRAPVRFCFETAADVVRWPDILPHYRWVRFHEGGSEDGIVEMAAWRTFPGGLRYPTWWVSRMRTEHETPRISYHHVRGVTRGMDVSWEFHPQRAAADPGGRGDTEPPTLVRITHVWAGPRWPLIRGIAARHVIGPHFVSAIAGRTLAGIAAEAERRFREERQGRSGDRAMGNP